MVFSIGHVSRILGFTRQAVRFYEEKGIINPRKDDNGWRHYDEEAISRLISARKYMAMGYRINEVVAQFSNSTTKKIAETLDRKYEETKDKINHLQMVAATIDDYRRKIRTLDDLMNQYVVCHSPPMAIFYSQPNNDLKQELVSDTMTWVNALPLSKITAFYDGPQLHKEKILKRKHKGFSIDQLLAEKYGLLDLKTTCLMPSKLCIHTVIAAKSNEIASLNITNKDLPFLEKEEMEIEGDPWGQIIFSESQQNTEQEVAVHRQYIDLWIPIRKQ